MSQESEIAAIPGHILVVEDEDYLRRGLWQLLTLESYTVTCAEDGMQGWELFETLALDLVITDLKMPRMDGIELLQRIRAQKPNFPIILLTGYADLETEPSAFPYERCDLILKPFDQAHLLTSVKRALDSPGTESGYPVRPGS